MTPSPLIVSPADRPRALNIAGTAVTILASGAQTAGYEIFHTTGPEGTGPGSHSHSWDESFYVIPCAGGQTRAGGGAHYRLTLLAGIGKFFA